MGPSSRARSRVGSKQRRVLQFELLDERRVLASISGQVFHDADLSLRKNDAEIGLADRVVYLDLNNNSVVDFGEPVELTDAEGRFKFSNLTPGDYVVRLFNGTESQQQVFPFQPTLDGAELPVVDPHAAGQAALSGLAGAGGVAGYTASGRTLTDLRLEAQQVTSMDLASEIHGIQPVGDGLVLAWTNHVTAGEIIEPAPLAVLANPASGKVTALELSLPEASPRISDLAVAANNLGLFVPYHDGQANVPLYSFSLDVENETWSTKELGLSVASGTKLLASASGPLVLVAQPTSTGTQVSLVSTVTESVVSSVSMTTSGSFEFLAFDDESSLAVARNDAGTVHVYDTANSFALLKTVSNWAGQVVLDGDRELLFGLRNDGNLHVYDIVAGKDIALLPLGSSFAAASAIALTDNGNRLLIRRPSGVSQVRIDQIGAHRVTVGDDLQSVLPSTNDIFFGMVIHADNLPPSLPQFPTFQILRNQTLFSPAPGVFAGLENPELDNHIAVKLTQPEFGIAALHPNGTLTYIPLPDFVGVDSFQIAISDGRDALLEVPVVITVVPPSAGPGGVRINGGPVPELTVGPATIGTIEFENGNPDDFLITLVDPRFQVQGNELILVGGGELDFESEPTIQILITVTNPENPEESYEYSAELTIEDGDDPPTDILPRTAQVEENSPGAVITALTLVDQDEHDHYVLTVSDSRFVIVDRVLRLVDSVSLDFETEPTVLVTVTVATPEGQQLLSKEILITVTDVADSITDITLSRRSLPEYASGYRVGTVGVVDHGGSGPYLFGVDDQRFEIVGANLRLRNGIYVIRAEQAEIQLTISATPTNAGPSFSKQFVIDVLANDAPWHNYENPTDVDGDGHTEPLDALIIINQLNNRGVHSLQPVAPHENGLPRYYDVNGDGMITPLDALIIINQLNRGRASAEPENSEPAGRTTGSAESPEELEEHVGRTVTSPFPFDDEDDEDE